MGRPKGVKNKPKDSTVFYGGSESKAIPSPGKAAIPGGTAEPIAHATIAEGSDDPRSKPVVRGIRDLDRANEIEVLIRKYERGARLLGLMLNDVDRLMGESEETMSRRKRFTSTGLPLPPAHVALYQRHIPLTEEYLRAETVGDLPDNRVLDMGLVQLDQSGRAKMVRAMEKSMGDLGVTTPEQVARTIEFVVALGYLRMEPQEVFDAAMSWKMKKTGEEFERARKAAGGGEGK